MARFPDTEGWNRAWADLEEMGTPAETEAQPSAPAPQPAPNFVAQMQQAVVGQQPAPAPQQPESDPVLDGWRELQQLRARRRAREGTPEPQPEPEVGTSDLAQELERSGWFLQQEQEHRAAREQARQEAIRQSTEAASLPWWAEGSPELYPGQFTAPLFGAPPTAEDFAAGERTWGQRMERFWTGAQSLLQAQVARRAERNRIEREVLGTPEIASDPLHSWLQRHVTSNIAESRQRQRRADEIERGDRPGPTTSAAENLYRRTGHGVIDGVVANTIKGIAYTSQYFRGGQLSETAETGLYQVGQTISDWAREVFPEDEARQYEFSGRLAEGFGSMVGFVGPSAAVSLFVRGGPRTMALIAGGTASVTGAFSQAGHITDDALRAMQEGRTVDGRPITEENLRWAYGMGLVGGITEGVPVAHLFVGHKGLWMRAVLAQAIEEGGQEFGQQVLENVVARANYHDQRQWDENAWEGLLIGGILGGGMEGGRRAGGYARGRAGGAPAPAPDIFGTNSWATAEQRAQAANAMGASAVLGGRGILRRRKT
jgi:hypothetical protein